MARSLDNADRNFFTNGDSEDSLESLRGVFANSEPALPYNEASKTRIGKVISNAVLPSRIRAPLRILGTGLF